MKLDTWEGLTLLVARLSLAPFLHYSSPLKRAIDNLDNLSERLLTFTFRASRGDLKWPYCTGWTMAQYAGPSYETPPSFLALCGTDYYRIGHAYS